MSCAFYIKAAASSKILTKNHETERGITQKLIYRRQVQWNTDILQECTI